MRKGLAPRARASASGAASDGLLQAGRSATASRLLRGTLPAPIARQAAALPGTSDIDLFGYGKGVVDFDTEVTHRALDFFMLQQELHCAQVAGATVNECGLGSAQRMCAKQAWVEPDAGDPLADQPSILPCRNSSVAAATAAKEVLTRLLVGGSDVVVDCLTGLLGHLEPDRLAGLLLAHRRAIDGMSVRRHIFHLEADN